MFMINSTCVVMLKQMAILFSAHVPPTSSAYSVVHGYILFFQESNLNQTAILHILYYLFIMPVQLCLHNMHNTKKDRNKDKNLKKVM